jgi:pimeloyl-ACP methyl ester carboxylesterase
VLNLGPVHLVGHSYGAFTALLTTIDHPDLVRSLTLGEAPVISLLQNVPGGDTILNNFITKAFVPAAEAFKNNNDEKAVDVFVGSVIGDSLFFSRLPQETRDMMMANTPELKGVLFSKNVFLPITCDDLKKIKVPVLLLTGDRSPLFFTSIASELDRCLSNKKSVTLPNSSHGLEFENPVEFNKIVLGFIDKN